jgi:acyl carrier protein
MPQNVEAQLRDIIAAELNVEPQQITGESTVKDWGGDSLELLELLFQIESHFSIQIPDEEAEKISDFSSIVACVEGLVERGTE